MVSRGSWPSRRSTLTVPAHPDFLAAIRAMTRSMAVLADLTLEDAEALQIAVDEAAILLLPVVDDKAQELTAAFEVVAGSVRVMLRGRAPEGAAVDRSGLPWMMLSSIDVGADVRRDGEDLVVAVAITERREDVH